MEKIIFRSNSLDRIYEEMRRFERAQKEEEEREREREREREEVNGHRVMGD